MKPWLLLLLPLTLISQTRNPERKHLCLAHHLVGDVEIEVLVCLRSGGDDKPLNCGGDFVIHADSAEMHEDTGAIEAHGTVAVTPTKF